MNKFIEITDEKQGQRRRRFLKFLRDIPMPNATFNDKIKQWIPYPDIEDVLGKK